MKAEGIALILLMLLGVVANGQDASSKDNTPKYSNEFLNLGVDARAFGMGLSMVAHTRSSSSGYWNPAGLSDMDPDHQLGLMHASYFAGIANYDYGSFATRIDDSSALSISVLRFAVDDIADTRLLFDPNGSVNYDNIRFFSAADYAFLVSYGRKVGLLGGLNVGGNVKVIRRVVGDFASSWGFGVDIGLQKHVKGWNFGLVGKDIFGTFNSWSINDEELLDIYSTTNNDLYSNSLEITLPRLILGVSREMKLADHFTLLASMDLVTTFDGKRNAILKTDLASVDPSTGFEFGFKKVAFLRAGIGQFQQIRDFDRNQTWSFQPNVGLGFILDQVAIDYAFTDIGDQAAGLYSHVFSLKVDFNAEN